MNFQTTAQESRYARIRDLCHASGKAADYAGRSFDDFDLKPFLAQVLPALTLSSMTGVRALEYGTGTGPGACFLASRGFQVEGIDLSATAIELAREFAVARGLTISFRVGDISQMPCDGPKYDLIVDNFCLHCIVSDAARARTFQNVRSMLQPGGYFIIGTALQRPGRDFGENLFVEDTGILYQRVPQFPKYQEAIQIEEEWYVPWRRYVTAASLTAELQRSGWTIIVQENGRVLCQ
jgi:SAM-dependent methyltransferase